MRFHKIWFSCFYLLPFLLCLSGFFAYAAEFGTSDIYTASIVAARNNVPVLLYRDAQCTLCSKIEDFLVGLGTQYQTVSWPFVCPCKLRRSMLSSRMPHYSGTMSALIFIWQFYVGTSNKTALQLLQVRKDFLCHQWCLSHTLLDSFCSHLQASMNSSSFPASFLVGSFMIAAKCWYLSIIPVLFLLH